MVGGGVIGTSAAFHLAEAGSEVLLLERAELASGSTSKAAGGVRAQFSDPLNIAIGLRSLEAFERFPERPGAEIDLHRVGYLFLLDREEDVPAFERSVALQNALGVPSRFVTLDEAATLSPLAGLDGVVAATFSPYDGHAAPEAVVLGYAAGARAHGATVVTGCEVTGIALERGTIRAVHTTLGEVATGTVICCAGAWSRAVGELVGVELPVEPVWREITYTAPVPGLPTRMPLTIDFSTGFYFHREGPGLLFGMGDRAQPAGFDAPTTPTGCCRSWWWRSAVARSYRTSGWPAAGRATTTSPPITMRSSGRRRRRHASSTQPGSRVTASCRARRWVRSCAISSSGASRSSDVSPLSAMRFASGAARPERNVI